MPLAAVTASVPSGGYLTLAYEGLVPIFTADGAAVPQRPRGRWSQLTSPPPAGRPL
jgi:hypothetical protein